MTSKELRKLSRKELIELFLAQSKEYAQVKGELTHQLEQTRTELSRELEVTKKEVQVSEMAIEQLKLEIENYKRRLADIGQETMALKEEQLESTESTEA